MKIATAVLVVLLLAPGLSRLKLDNSFEVWFPSDDPALVSYHHFLHDFGNDETVLLGVRLSGPDALSEETHRRLVNLSNQLRAIDGVASVASLASMPAMDPSDDFLDAETRRFENYFSDGTRTAVRIIIVLAQRKDLDRERSRILDQVNVAARRTFPDNTGVWLAGTGVILNGLNSATLTNAAIFLPLSYGLILLVLFMVTRSLSWVGATVAVLALANIGMFGLMGWLDRPVTMMTMALPPIALVVTVSSMLHLFRSRDRRLAARPIIFSALTSAAGFFSLGFADMAITRDYGCFAGAIILLSLVLTLAFSASLSPGEKRPGGSHVPGALMEWAAMHSRLTLAAWLTLTIAAGAVLTGLTVDTYSLGFLPADSKVVQDSRAIETSFGPYVPLDFIVERRTPLRDGDARGLLAIHTLQTAISAKVPGVGDSFSYADARAMADLQRYDAGGRAIPIDPGEWMDATRQRVRVRWHVPMGSAKQLTETADQILSVGNGLLHDGETMMASGYLPLYSHLIDEEMTDQTRSLAIAILVIFLLVAWVLRDLQLALVATVINLVPIVLLLATMAALGISLDIATITIAPAMLGLIVDDTIHLLYRFRTSRLAGGEFRKLGSTIGNTLTLTSLVLILGFLVLGCSPLGSLSVNGLLMAWVVALALAADLILMPALVVALGASVTGPVKDQPGESGRRMLPDAHPGRHRADHISPRSPPARSRQSV